MAPSATALCSMVVAKPGDANLATMVGGPIMNRVATTAGPVTAPAMLTTTTTTTVTTTTLVTAATVVTTTMKTTMPTMASWHQPGQRIR